MKRKAKVVDLSASIEQAYRQLASMHAQCAQAHLAAASSRVLSPNAEIKTGHILAAENETAQAELHLTMAAETAKAWREAAQEQTEGD